MSEHHFSELSSDRTGVNGCKLKDRRFVLNIRKHLFYCDSDGALAQVAQSSCGVSLLVDIQGLFGPYHETH